MPGGLCPTISCWDGYGVRGMRATFAPMRTIVNKLRRKLGDDADNPVYIFTEPRVGYRMPKGETADTDQSTSP